MAGDFDVEQTDVDEQNFYVDTIFIHPDFSGLENDFAILHLNASMSFAETWAIQKMCLPTSCSDGCAVPDPVMVAGWGATDSTETYLSRYLRATEIMITSRTTCSEQYSTFTDSMLCAGLSTGGADFCAGDDGGPLLGKYNGQYKICGIASYGGVCGNANSHGVYA